MKACVLSQYGSTDYLAVKEIAKPEPEDNEIQVKIFASSVNSWDWELLIGKPFVNRLMAGLFKPHKINLLGCDIAGRVEKVGKKVTRFQPGDEVFGDLSHCKWGGFAEFVCVSEAANVLALKPPGMSFEQAASMPQAAVLALQGLRQGKIVPGQQSPSKKVLINGASGGVGTFAMMMAKSTGAEITAVCSSKKMDLVQILGADHIIDYKREDFTKSGRQYDLILDVKGMHSLFDYRRALTHNGIYVMAGGSTGLVYQILLIGSWLSMLSNKKTGILMHKPDTGDLDFISTLFTKGKLTPVIDKCFPLCDSVEAIDYYAKGRARGKIVITINHDGD